MFGGSNTFDTFDTQFGSLRGHAGALAVGMKLLIWPLFKDGV